MSSEHGSASAASAASICITPGCGKPAIGGTYAVLHCRDCNDVDLARITEQVRRDGQQHAPDAKYRGEGATDAIFNEIAGVTKEPPPGAGTYRGD